MAKELFTVETKDGHTFESKCAPSVNDYGVYIEDKRTKDNIFVPWINITYITQENA